MLLLLVAVHAVAAVCAPGLVRRWGRRALYVVALAPAAAAVWALTRSAAVADGGVVTESYPWVPDLGLALTLRMGTLGWLMVVLVGGVGALVLAYCARYFAAGDPALGRFAAVFVGFAGAMLGLVVSDDLLLLYVFWELTTVFSYLLIAHDPTRRASRRAALQALLVTTLGGLAMLAGFVMLGQRAGTYRWSQIALDPPSGGYLVVALVLILLGALSKSAIFPFSFWLPSAMAAPTPVSAYLHAAAMVKAGVFLVGLLGPAFADDIPWRGVLQAAGTVTVLLGGWAALRQTDLKLLLAYGTVSQLGFLMVVFGSGTRNAALAGATMLLAHALFKAALFLVVGVIDHTAGTRDLRELSGLGRRAPALAATAALAAASMAGLPPLAGFLGKEASYDALLHGGLSQRWALAGLVLGSVLTVAYTARFLWGGFRTRPGAEPTPARAAGPLFLTAPAVLALAGLGVGIVAPALDRQLTPYAVTFPSVGPTYHLALWHGFTVPLGLSALAVVLGLALFLSDRRLRPGRLRLPFDGSAVFERSVNGVDRAAVEVTGATQRGSLPFYLGVILLVLVVGPGGTLLAAGSWRWNAEAWDTPLQAVAAAAVVVAAVSATRALRRLTAMVLVGVAGYGVAVLFVLHGAPDLALTQFLVETVTIVMFVLVLRRLPATFSERPIRSSRIGRVAVGVAVGVVAAAMAYVAVGARQAVPISAGFAEPAVSYGGGNNIVNVILVDIRAWDTMGEVAVLVAAATGVASLVFRRSEALRRRRGARPAARRGGPAPWLATDGGPDSRGRSVILQVVTRLLFHTIVLFSIYLLLTGHNTPGGGFAGGLVAGLALALRYLAGGQAELTAAAPVDAGTVLGAGLLVAVGTGAVALLLGGDVLQSAIVDLHLPLLGDLHLVTSTFFDVGVYLIVVGLVLDILRSLGVEMDRQAGEKVS